MADGVSALHEIAHSILVSLRSPRMDWILVSSGPIISTTLRCAVEVGIGLVWRVYRSVL